MTSSYEAACAGCGRTVRLGSESRPAGQARCVKCRREEQRQNRKHGAGGYVRGCRCDVCKQAAYARNRERYWTLKEVPTERACMICGVTFVVGPSKGGRNNAAKTCSPACAQQRVLVNALDRGARQRNAFVEPVIPTAIFERDRWRCHICRRKLSLNTRWPHRRAATLDHLVPLSLGGKHERANVKTACLSCNSSKGNRGGNEQLLLIG